MGNGGSKMTIALSEEDFGELVAAVDSIGSVHAGNELDIEKLEAVPEQDSDIGNPAQAINEIIYGIMEPRAGLKRAEIKKLFPVVASGEYDFFPPDQVSTDQPRLDAAPAFEWNLGPWVMLNDQVELDADEAEALLSDLNAVQAELNELNKLALLLALGSAVGLPRQLEVW